MTTGNVNHVNTGCPSSRYEYITKSKHAVNILRNRNTPWICYEIAKIQELIWKHDNCNLFVSNLKIANFEAS